MAEAWRAVRIWAEPSLAMAMTMTEADLQKKLHHQCHKAPHTSVPRPNGGGHRPPGGGRGGQSSGSGRGTAYPIGQTDTSGFPKGYARHQSASSGAGTMNPFTARTLGIKRDMSGKQKTSSTGATDNSTTPTEVEMVPCKACGGYHSKSSHDAFGTNFECPYLRNGHTQVNATKSEFLLSPNGKQYSTYPWQMLDKTSGLTTNQYRLKYGEYLESGVYVEFPPGHPV